MRNDITRVALVATELEMLQNKLFWTPQSSFTTRYLEDGLCSALRAPCEGVSIVRLSADFMGLGEDINWCPLANLLAARVAGTSP